MEVLNLKNYQIVIGNDDFWTIASNIILRGKKYSKVMVLVDENTLIHCLPVFENGIGSSDFHIIQIPSGEANKGLDSCQLVWNAMIGLEADRQSLLVNLGGGVIGDLGGFAASTFKRGMDFIQMPTTLLGQVDSSIGGKLGIDFTLTEKPPLKNLIGLFHDPTAVLINPDFLSTLPLREVHSGFAEVIKHALIADLDLWNKMQNLASLEKVNWSVLVKTSLDIKKKIVEQDPFEEGIRKSLNFGHTIGHALESDMMDSPNPLLHGEAIAIGMICEAWLSSQCFVLKTTSLKQITAYILRFFKKAHLDLANLDRLIALMRQDKKNEGSRINFTLLRDPGTSVINQHCDEEMIVASLRYYQDL